MSNNSKNTGNAVNRRRFLQSTGTAGAAIALSGAAANAQSSLSPRVEQHMVEPKLGERPFLHGVASGDPIPDSVILWTRVTPEADAMPGSELGEATRVEWEIAKDEGFGDVVKRGGGEHRRQPGPHRARGPTRLGAGDRVLLPL